MFALLVLLTLAPILVRSATLTLVSSWGSNPSNLTMHIYVPNAVQTHPPIIVALHGCGSSGPDYFNQTTLPSYADSQGYILIYPSTTKWDNCWEAHTAASITHDGGSDNQSIANMVSYALTTYSGNSTKVYIVGTSSGAMMATVLAATYPNVFAAVAAFSGAPIGCLYGSAGSNPANADPACLNGTQGYTTAQLKAFVTNAYPAWYALHPTSYPRMQFWHGTADPLIKYQNFVNILAQWTAVFNITYSWYNTNMPNPTYIKWVYGDNTKVNGYSGNGVGHPVPVYTVTALQWFGILP